MQHNLKTHSQLESSCIVANNRMNRERVAQGSNGYESEIGFDPIEYLQSRYQQNGTVRWLDLCCGRGKALIESGEHFAANGLNANAFFLGVDLVDMFDPIPENLDFVQFEINSLHAWDTNLKFDLITCVHGMHYVGDKLDLIFRAANWLSTNGQFHCNLDLNNLRSSDQVIDFESRFTRQGFTYDSGGHLLSLTNSQFISLDSKLEFVGADDDAGPNYTGQETVNSHYRLR